MQYAQNLLECNNEPIEYSEDDGDYHDNCFFLAPEDCVYHPPKHLARNNLDETALKSNEDSPCTMNPVLPDIKMLDPSALSELLKDNLSPPEITSIAYVLLSCRFDASLILTREIQNIHRQRCHLFPCILHASATA